MNFQNESPKPYTTLLKDHCKQWKVFFDDRIQKRNKLGHVHREEKNTFRSIKNYSELAVAIQLQVSEIMEFLVLQQEEQRRLRCKQDQEKLDLIKPDQ